MFRYNFAKQISTSCREQKQLKSNNKANLNYYKIDSIIQYPVNSTYFSITLLFSSRLFLIYWGALGNLKI